MKAPAGTPSKNKTLSIEEYNTLIHATTKKEVDKLEASPEYQKFLERTGRNQQNHCWQSRQEQEDDDEIDNLDED